MGFTREVGTFLQGTSLKVNATVFERFRAVLNERSISHRVQCMIEVLMQVRKDKYKEILPEGLDFVEEQITHEIQHEEDLKVEGGRGTYPICYIIILLNSLRADMFKFDPNNFENEEKYKVTEVDILGEGSPDDESGSERDSEGDDRGMLGRPAP